MRCVRQTGSRSREAVSRNTRESEPGGGVRGTRGAIPGHIVACPRTRLRAVIATSPNCRGGTRQSVGLCTSTATAPV